MTVHMKGVEAAEAGWFTRLVYWFVRRKFGKLTGKNRLIEPVKVAAHHPRLLRAIGRMEGGLEALRRRVSSRRRSGGGPHPGRRSCKRTGIDHSNYISCHSQAAACSIYGGSNGAGTVVPAVLGFQGGSAAIMFQHSAPPRLYRQGLRRATRQRHAGSS